MFIDNGKSDTLKYASVEIKKDVKILHGKLSVMKNFYNYIGVSYIKNFKLFKKLLLSDKKGLGELAFFFKLNQKDFNVKKNL